MKITQLTAWIVLISSIAYTSFTSAGTLSCPTLEQLKAAKVKIIHGHELGTIRTFCYYRFKTNDGKIWLSDELDYKDAIPVCDNLDLPNTFSGALGAQHKGACGYYYDEGGSVLELHPEN